MKQSLITGLFLLLSVLGFPQGEFNNWYFGDQAGITFNFGSPVALTDCANAFNNNWATCTVSDSLGALLFYSDGFRVFNKNHSIMPNGNGLSNVGDFASQIVFAVQSLQNKNLFFLFTIDIYYSNSYPNPNGLRYSIINMQLNGGLGDIPAGQKNISIPSAQDACMTVTGTRHHNNRFAWVVTRKYLNTSSYASYLVSNTGLSTIPVLSNSLIPINVTPPSGGPSDVIETIKISPDGSKLVATYTSSHQMEVCNFNSQTGQIIPLFLIPLNFEGDQGFVEFSRDSKYIYVTEEILYIPTPDIGQIVQFDATKNDSLSFIQSKDTIATVWYSSGLQLGPDGKIYCTKPDSAYLSVINNPSVPGSGCNFQRDAVDLLGNNGFLGFPQLLQRYYVYISHSGQCQDNPVGFSATLFPPADSLHWDFGDPASGYLNFSNLYNPIHIYASAGTYNVTLIVRHNDNRMDTALQVVNIIPSPQPNLGSDQIICIGDSVTFDAGACTGCTYLWKNLGSGATVGTSQTFRTGQAGIYTVTVTSPNSCIGRDTVQLFTTPIPFVTNTPLSKTICSGDSTYIVLTSNPMGANFYWTASLTSGNITGFTADSGLVINQVLVNHNSSPGLVTYHITPKVGSCVGTPSNYEVTVNPGDSVKISIVASATNVCAGTSVTFTATAINGGSTPQFQWKVNGTNTGTNNPIFSYTPVNGDNVYCVLTSSNTTCTSNNPATSDTIVMVVNPNLPVSVSVTPSENPVCAGTSVTFTATPTNGGTNPTYQWKVNGVNVGTNSPVYTYIPVNGDLVWCTLTSSEICTSSNPASSIQHQMIVNDYLPVSVSITASANPVCAGTNVTFTATPVNGGTSPTYQWKVNGVNVGTNNQIYTYVPINNDVITCILTSNVFCPIGNPATSNPVTMTVNPLQPVSVSIAASQNPVCAGTTVIYTATPTNGGTSPVYQWKVNGVSTGTNNPEYSYTPVNNDVVTCVLTSNVTCPTGNPATSNPITMTVNIILPVSVIVTASQNPVCAGTNVTFTATPTNGGTSPVYQWKVNGLNIGTNNPVYNYIPLNGDMVWCILTSLEVCTSSNPASSTQIQMVVNNNLPASVTVTGSPNPFCPGVTVSYTATPVNGGTSPVYQWKVNGNNTGTNSPVYSYSPQPSDSVWCVMTSNLSCVSGSPATSNKIIMVSSPVPVVTFTRCFDSITTLNAKPIKLKGGIPLNGTYSGPGVNSATGVFTPLSAGTGTKTITYTYTNAALCSASKTKTIFVQSTPAFTCRNNLTDIRDNKIYPTVQIGSQCWMASNLNYGSQIPGNTNQRDNCIIEKYCYNDLSANCGTQTYYQWDELMRYDDTPAQQGLCPPGWHIPIEAEWNILFTNWINNAFAGAPMKYSGYSGFNALLSGVRHLNVQWDYQNFATFFWSSTSYGAYKAWAHGMNDYNPSVSLYPSLRSNAFSVRCLKD